MSEFEFEFDTRSTVRRAVKSVARTRLHSLVLVVCFAAVKNRAVKAHLKTASSAGNDVLVLANAQVMRNKTSVLEQIPTYEIVTNVLNNQLETPIARMKNSATPVIGGPAVHEFGVAYVWLSACAIGTQCLLSFLFRFFAVAVVFCNFLMTSC